MAARSYGNGERVFTESCPVNDQLSGVPKCGQRALDPSLLNEEFLDLLKLRTLSGGLRLRVDSDLCVRRYAVANDRHDGRGPVRETID